MTRDGLLLVDKSPGCTSHDVVQRVRRILQQKRIGHCGTLDPDATGLLLLTLGQATRLTRFLLHAPKIYEGRLRFGVATDTYDAAGRVVEEHSIAELQEDAVRAAMPPFIGTYEQKLPPYSARKVGGVKLYELARRGEEVPESSKEVTVYDFSSTGPLVEGEMPFRLACSSGTYARSLAHDLGRALGVGAHLKALRRTQIGPFEFGKAVSLAALEASGGDETALGEAWMPIERIPLPFPDAVADVAEERRLGHGQTVLLRGLAGEEGDWIRLVNRKGDLVALGTIVDRVGSAGIGVVQPRIVFKAGLDVVGF